MHNKRATEHAHGLYRSTLSVYLYCCFFNFLSLSVKSMHQSLAFQRKSKCCIEERPAPIIFLLFTFSTCLAHLLVEQLVISCTYFFLTQGLSPIKSFIKKNLQSPQKSNVCIPPKKQCQRSK